MSAFDEIATLDAALCRRMDAINAAECCLLIRAIARTRPNWGQLLAAAEANNPDLAKCCQAQK